MRAAAVVLYNNVAGAFSPTVAGSPPVTIPVVAISAADGGKKFIVNVDTKSGKPELVMYPEDAIK